MTALMFDGEWVETAMKWTIENGHWVRRPFLITDHGTHKSDEKIQEPDNG